EEAGGAVAEHGAQGRGELIRVLGCRFAVPEHRRRGDREIQLAGPGQLRRPKVRLSTSSRVRRGRALRAGVEDGRRQPAESAGRQLVWRRAGVLRRSARATRPAPEPAESHSTYAY